MKIELGCFSSILKLFMRKKISVVQSDIVTSTHFSLTPSLIQKNIKIKDDEIERIEENKAYQPILDIAKKLNDKEIKNIALTGPFGSGKSSVLQTLQNDFPQYNYINISLATLDCLDDKKKATNTLIESSDDLERSAIKEFKNKKSNDQDYDEILNRKIEYSILQQLIYKEKAEIIPQSRFKRIRHISNNNSCRLAIGIVLFLLSCCVLLEPKFLQIRNLYTFFACSESWKTFWDILLFTYILFAGIYAIKKLIIKTYNNRINKLNFKDGEIEINESTSIFNKHLDEIIYFFEVTRYDVVIIEDLDRFETHSIFLKLRELNHLLNNSNAIRRDIGKIVFIYAIKDDMFKDTSRTKFFDYISTVIPIINPSNSRDQLLNALKDIGVNDISDDVCMDLGIFIDDMRILKNIVNEYSQYRKRLQDNLSPKKMLGMILYKNYHPDDFSNLHKQDGIVYKIISNRTKYHNNSITEKDKEITSLKDELKQIQDFYSNQKAKELRALYVMQYIKENNRIQCFREGNNNFTPNQIIDSAELFQKLENNAFQLFYHSDNYGTYRSLGLDIKFQDIEKKVDPKNSYRERLNLYPKRIDEINSTIEKLQQEQLELRTLSLSQILKKYSAFDFYKDTGENRLIAFLIRAGYIDENYYDYISYFYPGVMTPSDRDFILDLKIGIKKDYNYVIYKPKAVVNDIHESLFSKQEILNIYILDFIVEYKSEYALHYATLKNNIKKHNALDFISTYYNGGKQQELFFNDIFTIWSDFFGKSVLKAKSQDIADLNFEILLRYFPKSKLKDYQNEQFKKYLSDKFEFINRKLDVILFDNIKFLTESLDISYNNLNTGKALSKNLLELIISGNHYTLESGNIQCILDSIMVNQGYKYTAASYSAILESQNNSLIKNINENISDCVDYIFPESSIEENENAIILILNNEEIDDDFKIEYLSRQNNKINLSEIDEKFWNIALTANIIKPIWQNIEKYISIESNKELNSNIIDFISKNSSELSQQKVKGIISESTDSSLFVKLIGGNKLSFDSYKKVSKSFNRVFSGIDLSSLLPERLEFLIDNFLIKLNDYNFKMIQDNFPNLLSKLLLFNKSEYLPNINTYLVNANTTTSILKSEKLSLSEKVTVIESLPSSIFDNDSTLANLICTLLNLSDKVLHDLPYIIELMSNVTDQQQKLSIFVRECIKSPYDKSIVKAGLTLLGSDYALIALQKNHRRKFNLTREHQQLAKFLKDNEFISKYSEDDSMIKINARNI
jgi:hypothetical protein